MESGSTGTLPFFKSTERQDAWDTFVSSIPGCSGTSSAGTSIPCAQNASTATLLSALAKTEVKYMAYPYNFLFVPVIDGPGGLLPDTPSTLLAAGNFSKIPFMAGTVLDEGTLFVPQDISVPEELLDVLLSVDSPYPQQFSSQYLQDIETLFGVYSEDPALGSPFGTGNETFGLSSEYKRVAAMLGDMSFQAPWREWIQAATAAGVTTFGYIFTDQNAAAANPVKGGTYSFCSGSP